MVVGGCPRFGNTKRILPVCATLAPLAACDGDGSTSPSQRTTLGEVSGPLGQAYPEYKSLAVRIADHVADLDQGLGPAARGRAARGSGDADDTARPARMPIINALPDTSTCAPRSRRR